VRQIYHKITCLYGDTREGKRRPAMVKKRKRPVGKQEVGRGKLPGRSSELQLRESGWQERRGVEIGGRGRLDVS